MIEFSIPNDPELTQRLALWTANQIWPGQGRDFGECRALAVIEGHNLLACMIYHNYDPDAGVIEISGACVDSRWLTRRVLKAMYEYPFLDCGCQAVVQRVSDDDTHQHRFLTAYGFERYRVPRLRGRGKAENLFVLTDDAWRNNRFNRKGDSHGRQE